MESETAPGAWRSSSPPRLDVMVDQGSQIERRQVVDVDDQDGAGPVAQVVRGPDRPPRGLFLEALERGATRRRQRFPAVAKVQLDLGLVRADRHDDVAEAAGEKPAEVSLEKRHTENADERLVSRPEARPHTHGAAA